MGCSVNTAFKSAWFKRRAKSCTPSMVGMLLQGSSYARLNAWKLREREGLVDRADRRSYNSKRHRRS